MKTYSDFEPIQYAIKEYHVFPACIVPPARKRISAIKPLMVLACVFLFPAIALGGSGAISAVPVDLTSTIYGYLGIIIFVLAYALVPLENTIHLRKSKPVLLAAGIIWVLLSVAYIRVGDTHTAHEAIKNSLLEYAELFLFLLAAMTYINAMEETKCFPSIAGEIGFAWVFIADDILGDGRLGFCHFSRRR